MAEKDNLHSVEDIIKDLLATGVVSEYVIFNYEGKPG
jgi:hypothetical protein